MARQGIDTTEYKIAKALAMAGTVLPSMGFVFLHYWPSLQTPIIVAQISAALLAAAGVLGYQGSRTAVKTANVAAQAQIAQQAIINGIVPPIAAPVANAVVESLENQLLKKL